MSRGAAVPAPPLVERSASVELSVYLQPQVAITPKAPTATEILIRPRGFIAPDHTERYYASLRELHPEDRAEREMESLVLALAAAAGADRRAVNISQALLCTNIGLRTVCDALDARRRAGRDKLVLEILEDPQPPDTALFVAVVTAWEHGAVISMDDFDRWNNGLSTLVRMPIVHQIKVSGHAVHSPDSKNLLPQLIRAAQVASATTVAEHVDSEACRQRMIAHGFDVLQGFHVGMPREVWLPRR